MISLSKTWRGLKLSEISKRFQSFYATETGKPRVCIIGAGPSGMSSVIHLTNYGTGNDVDVVCYEKQNTWGGLWNYSWRSGTDGSGELEHCGMYRNLYANVPKEAHEYPDYTYDKHYGKPVASFPPRIAVRSYLEGRYTHKADLSKFVKFNNVVRNVKYDKTSDTFSVDVVNVSDDKGTTEKFTHVIVAVGIFSTPHQPDFPGLNMFEGRVLHSHNLRNPGEFSGKRVLVVGGGYSAEELSMKLLRFGAKGTICSWHTKPLNWKWPNDLVERPPLQKFEGNTAYFKDGSTAEVDCVVLATGYLYSFPFMADDLRVRSSPSLYPDNLYKGVLWLGGGNNKVFYLGTQVQFFTFTMFDAQALWTRKYILGKLPTEPKPLAEMKADVKKWRQKCNEAKETSENIDFQADYVGGIINDSGYPQEALNTKDMLKTWLQHRKDDITVYKENCFRSNFTGTMASKPRVPLWQECDDQNWP